MNSFKSNVEVRNYVEVWRTNTRSGVGMRCTGLLLPVGVQERGPLQAPRTIKAWRQLHPERTMTCRITIGPEPL
jgi:hypothetical protein